MRLQDGEPESKDRHQEPVFKHFCKVCKRGFSCAGALGGHMRSHGSISESRIGDGDDEDEEFAIIHNMRKNHDQNSKHSYFLRTNVSRFTSSYQTTDHDQDFDAGGVHDQKNYSSSGLEVEESGPQDRRYSTSEEEDLAKCLVMLSSNGSYEEKSKVPKMNPSNQEDMIKGNNSNLFQCKACKKVFNSHQALGGHRASHKKVKGCYASKSTDDHGGATTAEELFSGGVVNLDARLNQYQIQSSIGKSNSKSHQCSICHRVFSSGQALGGHKRCHWLTSNLPADNSVLQNLQDFTFDYNNNVNQPSLDLNFPPFLSQNTTAHDVNLFLRLWGNGNVSEEKVARDNMAAAREAENDDEDDGRRKKMAKLSDLKEVPDGESSSRWLQMGIASSTP